MHWVDATWAGTQTGTGSQPWNSVPTAVGAAPAGSILYLQPSTYTNRGAVLTLDKKLTLASPGGAIIDP